MNIGEGRPLESRERILDAALEEFGEKGYEAASTNCVCRQADISKGLLFHYYKTKQQLFAEVLERCIHDLEQCDDLAHPFDEGCREQLCFFMTHPFHRRIISDLLVGEAAADQRIMALRERVLLLRRERLRRFLNAHSLRPGIDPEMALELIQAATDHLQDKYLKDETRIRQNEAALTAAFQQEYRQLLSMLLNGIVVTPAGEGNGGTEC